MNLVRKINTNYLIFLLFLFPVMVALDYYLIRFVVNYEVNDILLHESERIKYGLTEEKKLPASNYIYRTSIVTNAYEVPSSFKDTLIYEAYTDKHIPYRTYEFTAGSGEGKLKISLRHILLEMNELILWLFASTAFIMLVLAAGLFLIHRHTFKWAWRPFFENLSKLKRYDITNKDPVRLKPSNIAEFKELDKVVTALMDQVKKDFQNLKEFNENISHEIQTPLAVIRNKVVLLLERKNLDQKEHERIQAIYHETNKLSKIGKALTLISRIENQEFKRLDLVDVQTMVGNILSNMEEIISFKELKVFTELIPVTMECDHILADILFTNLIKNAVQHNVKGGIIKIELEERKLKISNTGEMPEVSSEKLFDRFQRGKAKTDSLGLGLAINQKICEIYGFRLDYGCNEDMHTFSLIF